MAHKILIIDLMHESINQLLNNIGYEVDYEPNISISEINKRLGEYEGLILRSKIKVDKQLIENGRNLKFIARAGAGLDLVDEEFLKEKNIILLNAPEGNRVAVGEHTLGMLLSLMNKLTRANQEVKNNIWDREENRGYEITGKTIGIIGYGHMGKSFAKCLSGFDCKVLAYDKYLTNYSDTFAIESSLETIFNETDILSLHIPLTNESKNWLDNEVFKQFKKSIWLINTARGEIVSFKTIVNNIQSGKLLGAGLDVLENEKLNLLSEEQSIYFKQLINFENVILSPHVAGWTFESYIKINETLVEKIKNLNT
jgi:D-3-phosphoglycerate dehydrogenase